MTVFNFYVEVVVSEVNISLSELNERMGHIDRQILLEEAAKRAELFFRQVDGTYSFDSCSGQVSQVIEMLLAAENMNTGVIVPDSPTAYLLDDIDDVKSDTLVYLNRILINLEHHAYLSSFKTPPEPFSTFDDGVFPPELKWYLEKAFSVRVLSEEEIRLQRRVKDLIRAYEKEEDAFWSAYEKQRELVADEMP